MDDGGSGDVFGACGIAAVEAASALLQRLRRAHPTAGTLEAADVQWWWRTPRASDAWPTVVQPGADGAPSAMVLATDWGDAVALDPIVPPGWPAAAVEGLLDRALAHAAPHAAPTDAAGTLAATAGRPLVVVLDEADTAARDALLARGFAVDPASDLAVATAWLDLAARPRVPALPAPYRLCSRADRANGPHWFAARSGPDAEARLRATSLYRSDLDLAVVDDGGAVAAYALVWHDPATGVGLVEPMRTEAGHRRRGLARHLLAAGLERLAAAGATRAKVCFQPPNSAARDLYLGAGFRAERDGVVFVCPATGG